MSRKTFKNIVLDRINSMNTDVIFWSDLDDLGGTRQIARALNNLIDDQAIVRISRGIYAKAIKTKYIDEPVIENGFETACIEALERLEIKWEPSQAVRNYNEGKTQQVPAKFSVRLKSRFRRSFSYGNARLQFEGNVNAR